MAINAKMAMDHAGIFICAGLAGAGAYMVTM
jgi:hypothetical protein